jgi:hypothetical protein
MILFKKLTEAEKQSCFLKPCYPCSKCAYLNDFTKCQNAPCRSFERNDGESGYFIDDEVKDDFSWSLNYFKNY